MTNGFLIKCLSNKFLQSSASRSSNRPELNSPDNVFSLLKQRMNEKVQIYSSQKTLRRNSSPTQRYMLNGHKNSSTLIDFKNKSLLKINLNKFGNSQSKKQPSQIFSRTVNLESSQTFRKSIEKSTRKKDKNMNC